MRGLEAGIGNETRLVHVYAVHARARSCQVTRAGRARVHVFSSIDPDSGRSWWPSLVARLCWCQLSPLDVFGSCRSTEKLRSKMTESLVNKAKLAEQAERYDDMAEVLNYREKRAACLTSLSECARKVRSS